MKLRFVVALFGTLSLSTLAVADDVLVRYVNVNNYDPNSAYGSKEGCDGTTYEKGFGTLARATRFGVDNPNSRILVGPGVYDQAVFGDDTPSRCQVRSGMIFESIEGPEKTIIVGGKSTADDRDFNGNGAGAVWCVRMASGGILRGFTITGGHTQNSIVSTIGYGGAVWAKDLRDVRIENCIITNNTSAQSVIYCGQYVNCVIKDNYSSSRHIAENVALVNCLVTDNTAQRAVSGAYLTLNSTFGPFTQITDSAVQPTCGYGSPTGPIVNSIFITRPDSLKSNTYIWMTNCFYISKAPHGQHEYNCRQFSSVAEMGLDVNYRPLKDGSAVGFASNDAYNTYAAGVNFTLDGVPRILNGNIDVGAYEYNWCEDFEVALGPDTIVTNVSAEVTLDKAGNVVVPAGASIMGYMKENKGNARCVLNADPGIMGVLYPANRPKIAVSGSVIKEFSYGPLGFALTAEYDTVVGNFKRMPIGFTFTVK
jgi:hypothetical protein